MRFPASGAIAVGLGLALGLGLVTGACSSSTSKADGCAPTSSISASGTLSISRVSADKRSFARTVYTLSQVQAEELFNSGLLTIAASDTDAGGGALDPHDPVVLMKMDPSTDDPGSYPLDAVHAQIAYCPTTDAKLVLANGALTGCAPSGTPLTAPLHGTLTVMSPTDKSIATDVDPSGEFNSLIARYGSQTQQCN